MVVDALLARALTNKFDNKEDDSEGVLEFLEEENDGNRCTDGTDNIGSEDQ